MTDQQNASGYVCAVCGDVHDELPDVGFDRPSLAADVPEEERPGRVRLNSDFCVVDGEYHFIRGLIEIPVHGEAETFGIGVWVSQAPQNFATYAEHPDTDTIGPFFGWLANAFVFGGAPTEHLKTQAHFVGGGMRSSIELEPTDHPLAVAQRDGITLDAAWAFVHATAEGAR